MKLREDIIDDLAISLIEKYKLKMEEEEYFEIFKKEISKYLEDDDNIVYISDKDKEKLLSTGIKGNFHTLDSKEIGGFKIVNKRDNTIFNNTIKNLIDLKRNSIGLVVQEFINEVGAEIE